MENSEQTLNKAIALMRQGQTQQALEVVDTVVADNDLPPELKISFENERINLLFRLGRDDEATCALRAIRNT